MDYLAGIHPVREALRQSHRVKRLLIRKGKRSPSISQLLALAQEKEIPVEYLSQEEIQTLTLTSSHQGVAAVTEKMGYLSLSELQRLLAAQESPLVVILDEIQDPQNLGAIIRSSYLLGAHGVILPRDRSAGLTPAVFRAAAGAVEHIPLVQVTNIVRTIETLQDQGFWMVGAVSQEGRPLPQEDLSGPLGLVIGNEGRGLRRLVRERCDYLLTIPILAEQDSLNASVAAGIFLYEIRRQTFFSKD